MNNCICPKCNDFPMMKLRHEEQEKIRIKCECGYDREMYLENYVKRKNNKQCVNNKNVFYCKKCRENFNKINDATHRKHPSVDLRKIIDINEYKEKYKKAKEHISNYIYTLKEQYIKQLNQTIAEIETAYTECERKNNLLLEFTHNLLMSYSYKNLNYNLISNIQNICVYNISSFTYQIKEKDYHQVISFIKTYDILQRKVSLDSLNVIDCITSHTDYVRNLLLLNDDRFASCSDDKTVHIYNSSSFQSEITITNNSAISSIIQLPNNVLVIPDDNALKFINLFQYSYSSDHIIEHAHDGAISSLIVLPRNRIASAGEDLTLKIWCVNLYVCLAVLSHHTDIITSLLSLHCKDSMVSTSFDNTLVLWDMHSYQSESVVDSIECWTPNGMVEIPNRRVLIARGQTLSVLNVLTYQIEATVEEDVNFRCFCRLTENQILFGGDRGVLGIYDVLENKVDYMVSPHSNHISSLVRPTPSRVVTSSWDETSNVWEINKIINKND